MANYRGYRGIEQMRETDRRDMALSVSIVREWLAQVNMESSLKDRRQRDHALVSLARIEALLLSGL
jgi:hypothetical protein